MRRKGSHKKFLWRYSINFVVAVFVILSPHLAIAAEPDYFDLSPEQLLNAEVVSVTKTNETVEQSPAAVYVITAEDIARSGVTSIPDALRMAPGVDVAQQGTGTWDINIRGFNKGLADQLLVMIDGRTIYNPMFGGTYWELQNLPLEDIERIEVVRGPGGTLWGANAVNGVINIITKKAQDTQGTLIRAAAGSSLQDSVLGQEGHKTSDNSYYRVYAQHLNDGPMRSPEGGPAPDSLRDNRTGFRYDRDDNLTVSGDAYVNTTDQLFSVPLIAAPYAVTVSDVHDSQGANLLAHWKKDYDDGSQLSLQSFVDYTQHDQVLLNDQEDVLDFNAQYNLHPVGPNQFIMGGGYRLTHLDIGDTSTLSITPDSSNENLFNFFAQDKIALVPDRWFLTLGSKVEHNSFTGFEFEPNARLQWFPDDKQTVWTSVSRAVRTPTPYETQIDLLDAVFAPGGPPFGLPDPLRFEVFANPHYEAEQTVAYEAGYRNQLTPAVSADIAAFTNYYTRIDALQLVEFLPIPAANPYYLLAVNQNNLMTAQTYGAEVATDWNVNNNWKLSAGASWLEMSLQLGPQYLPQYSAGQSPNYEGNLRSYWNINRDWSFDTSAYYVDRLVAFNTPAYVRLDTNLGWKIEPGIQLNFVGQNLLQPVHMEYGSTADLNAAEVPRSFYAKVTCKF
jgi:iron complex outermembrane receptor protein